MSKKDRVKFKGEAVTPALVSMIKNFLKSHPDWSEERLGQAAGYEGRSAKHSILEIIDPSKRRGNYKGEKRIHKTRYDGIIKVIEENNDVRPTSAPKENAFPFDEQLSADKVLEGINKKSKLISKTIAFVNNIEGENEDEKMQLISILTSAHFKRKTEHVTL